MEVECYNAWASSSPESCNSQMVCPLCFFFLLLFVHIIHLASGIMVQLRELLHSANVMEEGFELLKAAESKVAVLSGSRRARVRWLSATLDHLFLSGKDIA